jgi:hypothetical protein
MLNGKSTRIGACKCGVGNREHPRRAVFPQAAILTFFISLFGIEHYAR